MKMFESWFDGWAYLISDDLISYYSFFTAIFAEIAILWAYIEDTWATQNVFELAYETDWW